MAVAMRLLIFTRRVTGVSAPDLQNYIIFLNYIFFVCIPMTIVIITGISVQLINGEYFIYFL